MTPTQDDRVAYRHVPWGGASGDEDWVFLGENIASAAFKMQCRPAQGDTATALFDLANAAAGSQGISAVYDSGYLDPETGEVAGATIVTPLVTKATLEAIPAASDPSQPRKLFYDLIVTRTGGVAEIEAQGLFVLYPGVTI